MKQPVTRNWIFHLQRLDDDCELGRSKQTGEISTDGEKSDVAQIQQAGKTHHDIQAQRQHDVQQCDVDDAYPGIAKLGCHDREHQQQ